MEIWNESVFEVGQEEPRKEYRNKRIVFYPREVQEIIADVLKTFKRANIQDFGLFTPKILDQIFCIITYALDEKEQEKRLKNPEIISIEIMRKEKHRSLDRILNRPADTLKWDMTIIGELWDSLSRQQKIQAIIHELLHIQPDKPDKFRKHDRFASEYELIEKYLQQKEKESEMVVVATARKKKKIKEG